MVIVRTVDCRDCLAGYCAFFFCDLKTEGSRIFDRQKMSPHRFAMCHLIVIL